MKEKFIATVLVIMAVAMWTAAVINFMQGNVLSGVSEVLMTCSDVIFAWVLIRQEFYAKALQVIGKSHFDLIKALEKGVPAKLTIVGKHDGDDEGDEVPEEELTEDEKRIKRMAEEYDQLAGRLHRLQEFRDTDTYKQLPENSRYLLDKQCKAMDDYESTLKQRIQLECDTANKKGKKSED
jgi:hypothetical protein